MTIWNCAAEYDDTAVPAASSQQGVLKLLRIRQHQISLPVMMTQSPTFNMTVTEDSQQPKVCRKWSAQQLSSLAEAFKQLLLNGTQPGFAHCEQAKKRFHCLEGRS